MYFNNILFIILILLTHPPSVFQGKQVYGWYKTVFNSQEIVIGGGGQFCLAFTPIHLINPPSDL